ncbi:MAG TPA: hypothetical protein VM265_04565 [Sphingomicrobium sp.]|nr:hypothetical protein [Sphingomicrobium sp.]
MEPLTMAVLAVSTLGGLGLASWAALKGWNGWLELKRLEIGHAMAEHGLPPAGGRIELADLKERVRKLEAIAAGIDL